MTEQMYEDEDVVHLATIGLQNFAPYLMNRIMGRYNAALSDQMAQLGLSTAQMRTLAVLAVIDGILIRELAVYSVVKQSTLSRALDSLEADRLIRREADNEDGRAFRIYITDAGRTAFDALWPIMVESYENMFENIPEVERRAFVKTLQTMLSNVRMHDF